MDGSIGRALQDLASRAATMSPTPNHRASPTGSPVSFAAQLDASFQARAKQLGLHLPEAFAEPLEPIAHGEQEGVDALWQRLQLQSAASNGPGDALMQAISEAADARWAQRHHPRDLFGT